MPVLGATDFTGDGATAAGAAAPNIGELIAPKPVAELSTAVDVLFWLPGAAPFPAPNIGIKAAFAAEPAVPNLSLAPNAEAIDDPKPVDGLAVVAAAAAVAFETSAFSSSFFTTKSDLAAAPNWNPPEDGVVALPKVNPTFLAGGVSF